VITTVLAIYGATVSTLAVGSNVWFFRAAGPKLQAKASLNSSQIGDQKEFRLHVKIWNTGRHPIKVDLKEIVIDTRDSTIGQMREWHGPDLPISIPGQSGEEWWADMSLARPSGQPLNIMEMRVRIVKAGGRERTVRVPKSEWLRWL
jgi:hypothetical protein